MSMAAMKRRHQQRRRKQWRNRRINEISANEGISVTFWRGEAYQ
jgi:hypothetical protein